MRIYVGNLPFNSSEMDLRGLFEGFGEVVEAKIVTDRETGRSRGFGFVQMAERGNAMTAIDELNQKDFGGRALVVNEARERRPREFNNNNRY